MSKAWAAWDELGSQAPMSKAECGSTCLQYQSGEGGEDRPILMPASPVNQKAPDAVREEIKKIAAPSDQTSGFYMHRYTHTCTYM